MTFLLYGICTATMVPMISRFSIWWIGHSLDEICLYIMLLNFCMYGFGMSVATFRNSMGIFQKGWLRPAVTALLNLLFSLLLVRQIGLLGTIIGTLIARTCTLVWYDPWLVLRQGMKSSAKKYYCRYLEYLFIIVIAAIISSVVCNYLPQNNGFFEIVLCGFISLLISMMVLVGFGNFFPEQRELMKKCISLVENLFKGRRTKHEVK